MHDRGGRRFVRGQPGIGDHGRLHKPIKTERHACVHAKNDCDGRAQAAILKSRGAGRKFSTPIHRLSLPTNSLVVPAGHQVQTGLPVINHKLKNALPDQAPPGASANMVNNQCRVFTKREAQVQETGRVGRPVTKSKPSRLWPFPSRD
jgi:hypothetical protein